MRWPRSELAAGLTCLVLVTGCSTLPDPLDVAAGDLASSAATARIAADEHDAGHLTSTAAEVVTQDAIREVASAMRSLVGLSLTGERAHLRDQLLTEATALAKDLHDLSDLVSAGGGERGDELVRRIDQRTSRISDLESRVRAS